MPTELISGHLVFCRLSIVNRQLVSAVGLAGDEYGGLRQRFRAVPHEVEDPGDQPIAEIDAQGHCDHDRQQQCETQ